MLCAGLYHYCLSCSKKQFSVVMRRTRIQDCFILPYNGLILKAIQNKVHILPIQTVDEFWKMEEKYEDCLENLDTTEISPYLGNHTVASLPELYALADPVKIRDIYSTPIEYVALYEDAKPKFKKVKVPNESTFECPGFGYYQELSNNIQRHVGRLNAENLLLVETTLWYDKVRGLEASKIYELYQDRITSIPSGDIVGIYGEKLPEYILCGNQHILKLRKKRKVLKVPDFIPLSKEEKFSKIMLFFPLKPGQKIDTDRLGMHIHDIYPYLLNTQFQTITFISLKKSH